MAALPRRPKLLWLIPFMVAAIATGIALRERARPAPLAPAGCALAPGDRIVYSVAYSTDSVSDLASLFQDPGAGMPPATGAKAAGELRQGVRTDLEGTWVWTVLPTTLSDGGHELDARWTDARVSIALDGNSLQGAAAEAMEGLRLPISLNVDSRCAVRGIRLRPGTSEMARNLSIAFLASTQFSYPGTERDRWQVEEADRNGKYRADYRVVGRGKGLVEIVKSKSSPYERVARLRDGRGARTAQRPHLVPESRLLAKVSPTGIVHSLVGSEKLNASVAAQRVAQTVTSLRMTLVSQSRVADEDLLALARERASTPGEAASLELDAEDFTRAIYARQLGSSRLPEILAALASGQAPAASEAYSKLKAMIALHPESCVAIARFLDTLAPGDEAFGQTVMALAAVGSAEAQDALVRAIGTRSSEWEALSRLIPALGMVDAPTEAAQAALARLTRSRDENVATTAELSLGIMGGTLAARDPGRARGIVRDAMEKLREARDDAGRIRYLGMAGNTGTGELIEPARGLLESGSEETRAETAMALRFVREPAAESLLLGTLAKDPATSVREAAATAFGFREATPASVEALTATYAVERETSVRRQLLLAAARMEPALPEAETFLRKASESETDAQLRKTASEYLEKFPREPR